MNCRHPQRSLLPCLGHCSINLCLTVKCKLSLRSFRCRLFIKSILSKDHVANTVTGPRTRIPYILALAFGFPPNPTSLLARPRCGLSRTHNTSFIGRNYPHPGFVPSPRGLAHSLITPGWGYGSCHISSSQGYSSPSTSDSRGGAIGFRHGRNPSPARESKVACNWWRRAIPSCCAVIGPYAH